MKRIKKHKVKKEVPETSSAYDKVAREHDLAYYIHDRVELMHQVFSVLKAKDLRAMAPESVRRLSIDDLQELCTEELLGISSKRLCAILDGAEPPSDTESSSRSRSPSAPVETISLDSISSDEGVLSQAGSHRKKKHKRRSSKASSKAKRTKKTQPSADPEEALPPSGALGDQSRASRAGLTVLELLELQARARAIRAQLQQEQARKALESSEDPKVVDDDGDEVEIKEEAPEVVEISSSEDEKPDLQKIHSATATTSDKPPAATVNGKDTGNEKETAKKKKDSDKKKKKKKEKEKEGKGKETEGKRKEKDTPTSSEVAEKATDKSNTNNEVTTSANTAEVEKNSEATQTVTRRVNNLLITIPQQITRKIKLNRTKTVPIATADKVIQNESHAANDTARVSSVVTKPPERLSSVVNVPSASATPTEDLRNKIEAIKGTPTAKTIEKVKKPEKKGKDKTKKKLKVKNKKKIMSIDNKEGSDHDEITLQLSDSEKMDLLEDFDRKHYDNVSSTEESSSSDTDESSDSDNESSKDKTVDKSDSLQIVDEPDVTKDVEVVHDNFYKGIEDLNQETVSEQIVEKNAEETTKETETCGAKEKVTINDNTDGTEDESSDSDSDSNSSTDDEKHDDLENTENKNSSPKNIQDHTTDTKIDEEIPEITESSSNNDMAENSQQKSNESEINNEIMSESSNILGYVSIDKNNEENNIEISDINDIPVINDETELSEDVTNNKLGDQEVIVGNIVTEPVEAEQIEVTSNVTNVPNDEGIVVQSENNEVIASDEKSNVEATLSKNTETVEKHDENKTNNEEATISENTETVAKGEETKQEPERNLSEGEVSSNESSEVEALELKPEVVCISDEDEPSGAKKKKKKDKKSKKEKKSKKNKSDFRESGDQNFYAEENIDDNTKISNTIEDNTQELSINKESDTISLVSNDDVYEILELSDDSSCYEVEGTVLSKEPTVEEIAALSAKIDEIEREEVVTMEQIEEHERMLKEKDEKTAETANKSTSIEKELEKAAESEENLENMSWKDRYLGSTKVKRVLTTSNIFNALRKKNKELKKKLEESKKKEAEELMLKLQEEKVKEKEEPIVNNEFEEGSIEQYNTLLGSTKYVDPVPDPTLQKESIEENIEEPQNIAKETSAEERVKSIEIPVTGEMKKDAKQLLKIYKKLLKYNDISKQKDPNKVKKKKKKSKKKDGGGGIV